jgi:hypothetical protein
MESQRTLFEPLRRLDPERIGSYVLLGRLGAGAMGRVYLGRSAAGRLVAVKTIKLEFAEEDDFRARFAQEVAAARRVSGVFTAAVVAADPDADMPWLATAYVPAPSLDHLVRTCGPLPVPAIRWLAAGCAEALDSIHGTGLVHRDLKPSNVLVSPDGPRVIDFGVARAVERAHLTTTHGSVGTPAYMAPEQARDTRQATTASDIFSLGATLLFAASGHAPYHGHTTTDILMRLSTEPPDLSGLPTELADMVTGCLDRDPAERPTSAALLTQLTPYVAAGIGQGFGSSLPESALRLIEEYRHGPPRSAAATGEAGESTFGSIAPLPGSPGSSHATGPGAGLAWQGRRALLSRVGLSRDRPGGPGEPPSGDGARPGGPPAGAGGSGTRRRRLGASRRRRIAIVIAAVAAVAGLVVGGSLLGAAMNSGGNPSSLGRNLGAGPPPGPPQAPRGHPEIMMAQPTGDGNTVFVIHGSGWDPGRAITVRLAGRRASPVHPVVDLAGMFSYAINQTHEFFPGKIPLGTYEIVATGSGGGKAEAFFIVDRP